MFFPQYQAYQRDDHVNGYIYFMEAEGYHGIFPGIFLKRCKIGLSNNPQRRLDEFHSNQPPCNIKIIRTIYVQDMADVEGRLHKIFRHRNVKLKKSKEWFDLWPHQRWLVNCCMDRYEGKLSIRRVLAKVLAR